MNTIITEFPLQAQLVLRGQQGRMYCLTRSDIINYLMDTRGYAFADLDEHDLTSDLVHAYIDDELEVEACAIYSGKA